MLWEHANTTLEAPPRERRSTAPVPLRRCPWAGSSARAEIDLPPPAASPAGLRLLRASGDRPDDYLEYKRAQTAPPRERRSTRFERGGGVVSNGSSARAEIDPPRTPRSSAARWLLRASGDRPQVSAARAREPTAPPRERRSTPQDLAPPPATLGSSARAEIDPLPANGEGGGGGLLRASGDRPRPVILIRDPFPAPPRERRSTPHREHRDPPPRGSSARAEIDPGRASTTGRRGGLLRASGDRPRSALARWMMRRAPPRERRSTRPGCCGGAPLPGSSARAEIDPGLSRMCRTRWRLLRASGDRPRWRRKVAGSKQAPPRERRSTPRRQSDLHPDGGSSARAEIDPTSRRASASRTGLLRASGDRPVSRFVAPDPGEAPPRERRSTPGPVAVGQGGVGSSARAEIDPRATCGGRTGRRLLRASGDRPVAMGSSVVSFAAPPRERRSTLHLFTHRSAREGSSARAEIDRNRGRRVVAGRGLLRASGDRPQRRTSPEDSSTAPPRERRSTRHDTTSPSTASGSSARAEIDPRRRRGGSRRGGLLRASGDRPVAAASGFSAARAPPRERRSTLLVDGGRVPHAGSSARAEIDPRAGGPSEGGSRLLRASGDRPMHQLGLHAGQSAPPRERRSTRPGGAADRHHRGSSARAEIDPAPTTWCTSRSRLLRASGDRPRIGVQLGYSSGAPPRERRSTRLAVALDPAESGSSARAEIDPWARSVRTMGRRLLRASGDRPNVLRSEAFVEEAPPRERRSTGFHFPERSLMKGSSARAEIDPPPPRSRSSCLRLLRASGDRPVKASCARSTASAPPRERRSTPSAPGAHRRDEGSSARAEIDPHPSPRGRTWSRLLRASGDRPLGALLMCMGLPAPPRERRSTPNRDRRPRGDRDSSARAEIDPGCPEASAKSSRLLRASGDRPIPGVVQLGELGAPPRERRSTLHSWIAVKPLSGSSARAEIDPCVPSRRLRAKRLLRASGDRPAIDPSSKEGSRAPPRERRSTPLARDDEGRLTGSSARAEIDPTNPGPASP